MIAFVMNAVAWEPVIKETHWFTLLEDYSGSPYTMDAIDFDGNYIRSISGWKHWDGQQSEPNQLGNHHHPKISYYSWLDHQYRFKVNLTGNWEVGNNNSDNYSGPGLKNKTGNATNFWILNLKQGDKFNIEYYRPKKPDGSPFLVTGNVEGLTPANTYSGNNAIYGANGDGLVYYTMTANGDVEINIPKHTVIRSVSIIHKEYKAATYETKQITDNGNIGYETTLTGSGVLEDKRGAVPYITMRFGHENDMTFVRDLGEAGGARRYGAASIVNENNDFNFSSAGLQHRFSGMSTDQVKKLLSNKEWTVFTCEQENGDDNFNSIYPNYGSYYYFFPEVDGKLNMKFYCEGEREHMAFWYKRRADGSFPATWEQPSKISPSSGDNTNNSNFYEYTVNVEKGGVYYLCSNPTIVSHQQPIIRLLSYSFVPEFRLDPLWYVATDAEKEAKAVNNASMLNQDFTVNGTKNIITEVKCLGNIHSANAYFVADNANNKAYLNINNIVYNSEYENNPTLNDGGAVVVTVECEEGKAKYVLTVPYSAEKAVASTDNNNHYLRVRDTDATRNPNGKEVKKWDFFSQIYEVGQYSNTSSQLYNEIHKPDGLTADWVKSYVNIEKSEEPIFKSVYDMEGDNADMLHETEGLVFFTDANVLGIYNENNPSTSSFADRYIGLMNGGELWVPNLKSGDRIVVKMGVYGKSNNNIETQNATLHIENAQDAVGTALSSGSGDNIQYYDYVIGGSGVAAGNDLNNGTDIKDKSQPWGEYHFISTGGHFKLKVAETTELLKLYSIVIYKNSINPDNILTENELLGDEEHLQILNTQDFTTAVDNVQLHMHYRGLQEETNYASKDAMTGNLSNDDITITSMTSNQSLWYTFFANTTLPITPDKAKFGVFKARLGVQTMDENYVTDYAESMIPVGYRETKTYPYTWDFTDLKKYVSAGIDDNGTEQEVKEGLEDDDMKIWNEYGLRVAPEKWDGNIFASGGQLYGGTTMFDETRGIGITYDNNNNVTTMTGTSTDETGGLAVNDEGTYGFIIPQVDKEQAIYVRAAKVGNTQSASYEESNGNPTYIFGQSTNNFPYSAEATDESGDMVFALVMPSNLQKKHDVRLNFKGYEVKKIAVSDAPKTLSAKGWASESREYVTDPALASYMTGKDIRTYIVSGVDYPTKTVTLTRIDNASTKYLMPAAVDGDNNACVILNYKSGTGGELEGEQVNILDGGFHLFVPDIHDYGTDANTQYLKELWSGESKLVSVLLSEGQTSVTIPATSDGCTNFAFTCKYWDIDPTNGKITGSYHENAPQAFYRIATGNENDANYTGGATSKGHQGYLPISTSELNSTGNSAGARFSLVIVDGDEITGVFSLESVTEDNGRFYNLNGQQLDGIPNRSGLYIVNGKKVSIKNK